MIVGDVLCQCSAASNRTSMESKHISLRISLFVILKLLIEPVWNRNERFQRASFAMHLLIEPVWNRNVLSPLCVNVPSRLLIEPVWNRNTHTILGKLDLEYHLLIEPVWNRNVA